MNITIYTAGPIDLGQDIPNWRQYLAESIAALNSTAVIFDPATAYKQAMWGVADLGRSRYIEEVNLVALRQAQYFVVCLPKGVSSVGTPIEIDWAYASAKEIYILTNISHGSSVYLDNRIPAQNWINFKDTSPDSIKAAVKVVASRITRKDQSNG